MGLQLTNVFIRAVLDDLGADTAKLNGIWVGLYTAVNGSVGPNLAIGDLTEPTYTGYARQQLLTWTTAYLDGSGLDTIIDGALHFKPSDTMTANTILGAFLGSASAVGVLVGIDPAPSPVPLTGPTTILTITPKVSLDPNGNFGDFQFSS